MPSSPIKRNAVTTIGLLSALAFMPYFMCSNSGFDPEKTIREDAGLSISFEQIDSFLSKRTRIVTQKGTFEIEGNLQGVSGVFMYIENRSDNTRVLCYSEQLRVCFPLSH
jgi:hypothetical protein